MSTNKANLKGLTTVSALLAASCGVKSESPTIYRAQTDNGVVTYVSKSGNADEIEKIIGENDLTPVLKDGANIPAKYAPLIDAFGKISMGCTATHIGNGLALTAGHCFDAPEKRVNNVPCSEYSVEWGLRKDKPAYLKTKCVTILAMELNDDRDYAIFKVDQLPHSVVEVDLEAQPSIDTSITIFGHPQARPLEWSKVCTVQDTSKGPWGIDQLSHQCDTEPGNSGSTIINDVTLKVVAIHDGGRAPWNYGTLLVKTPLREVLGLPAPTPAPTVLPTIAPTVIPTLDPTVAPTIAPTVIPTIDPTVAPTVMPTVVPTPVVTPVPPAPTPTTLSFGPFKNNEKKVLVTLPASLGKFVDLKAVLNTEYMYDTVSIIDGKGQMKVYSGRTTRSLKNLQTPVTVRFESDGSVKSTSVKLSNISYHEAGSEEIIEQ